MNFILQVKNLTKDFGAGNNTVKAVQDISFNMHKGEFLAIVGPSGSGKTTLLSMIAGLIKPTAGKVIINGIDLGELKEKERAKIRREKIGIVFQYHNLVPYLTAWQNLLLSAEINSSLDANMKKKARDIITELGLADRINNLPSQLSGGERQRVAVGRAFMNNPDLILVDEPTASLDTERGMQVMQSIAEQIRNNGKTGIMVTHDIRMCDFVDKVIEIVDGRVV